MAMATKWKGTNTDGRHKKVDGQRSRNARERAKSILTVRREIESLPLPPAPPWCSSSRRICSWRSTQQATAPRRRLRSPPKRAAVMRTDAVLAMPCALSMSP